MKDTVAMGKNETRYFSMEMLEQPSSSRSFPNKTPTKRTYGLTREELEVEEPPSKKTPQFSFRIPRKNKDDVEEDDEVSETRKMERIR